MKKNVLLLIGLMVCSLVMAQDLIVTRSQQRIEARVTEVSPDEVKYVDYNNQEGPVFVLPATDVVTVIFQNGQVKVFEPVPPQGPQPNYLNCIPSPQYMTRTGDMYYYEGYGMRGKEYMAFLEKTNPSAYKQYKSGRNISIAGWVFLGVGASLDFAAFWVYARRGPNRAFIALQTIGTSCELACIPTLCVGFSRMHRTVDTFNATIRNEATKPYLSINASENGLGVALKF